MPHFVFSSELPAYPVYPAPPAYPPAHHSLPPSPYPPPHHLEYVQSAHHPSFGYGKPKHNCTVQDVVESAEVCTPAFETVCAPVELAIKEIIDREQCYPVTRTVCSESIQVEENEICTYSYQQKKEDTNAQTVEVTFKRECNTQMVTVCQPTPGYGYHSYGHNYCKEVAQETCYNTPVVTPVEPAVTVAYPEPIKTCVNKPIDLPVISCEDLTAEKCITVPEVQEAIATVEKCITQLGAPSCSTVELTLPKQVCKEINYGYAEETHDVKPYEPETPAPYHA